MSDRANEMLKIIVLDAVLAIVLVVCYSPGLLNLRPSDASILRAGFSILIVPISVILFYLINKSLFSQKSVRTFDGQSVAVKVEDADILNEIDEYNSKIKDKSMLEKSYTCRSCLADIFIRATEDNSDLTVPIVRNKLNYYLNVYKDTLSRILVLEKYQRTQVYMKNYREISSTLDLLQEVFLKALDQVLNNALNGAELDNIVLKNMMAMDGFGYNPFEQLKDKYS